MEAFPTQHERTAATALLLLSVSCCKEEQSPSDSCSSVLTSDDSSATLRADPLNLLALVACYHEIKPKILKRKRSRNYRISDCRKIFSGGRVKMIQPESKEEAPVPSSGSSAVSGAPIVLRLRMDRTKSDREVIRRKNVGSSGSRSMKRRAEAILKFLSVGCATEIKIRKALGDSPDTSKALRMLLKFEEVRRSGAGGRADPFLYTVTGQCSDIESA